MANNLDLALQRILSVEWKINDDAVASHLKLLREHFRRMVLWAKKLDCLDTWPYFSFTTYLDPTIQVDEAKKQAVRQHLKNVGIDSHLMIADLKYSLDWAAVLDMVDSNITSSLPDPYEPLLIFYERGGIYYKEMIPMTAIMVTERVGFPFSKIKYTDFDRPIPYVELDNDTLDAIDREWQKTQRF